MDEARAVLARLERIEALEREGAGTPALLAELRELVGEATVWAELECDARAREAAAAIAEADRRGEEEHLHRPHDTPVPSLVAAGPIE